MTRTGKTKIEASDDKSTEYEILLIRTAHLIAAIQVFADEALEYDDKWEDSDFVRPGNLRVGDLRQARQVMLDALKIKRVKKAKSTVKGN